MDTEMEFTLEVSAGPNRATDTVLVTVEGDNDVPIADAGMPQAVTEGDTVTLDGSGSADPERGGLTYEWSQTSGTPVTLSLATAESPTFTAPPVTAGTTAPDVHGAGCAYGYGDGVHPGGQRRPECWCSVWW
jgi:hypothetical protein